MKIQFGCGRRKKEGWVNVDIIKENEPEVVWNMNKFPYPFEDNSAEEIYCNQTLEHTEKPLRAIREFYRILKPSGKAYIAVPHATCVMALNGEDHIRPFWSNTFWSFYFISETDNEEDMSWAEPYPKFSKMKVKLIFPQNALKIINLPLMWLFSEGKFAQTFYEHFLSGIWRCSDILVYMEK